MQNLTIPQEILDEIMGYLSPQIGCKELLDYALVSKSWLTSIRRTYFKNYDVVIGNHPPGSMRRVLTLEQVNDPRSTITPFIKVVAIVGPETRRWNVCREYGCKPHSYIPFKQTVEGTTRSLRAQIIQLSLSSLQWPSLTRGTIPVFSSFPNLRDLRLSMVRFDHVSEVLDFITPTHFPNLQTLALQNCNFGNGRDTADLQGQTFPTFVKYISVETRPRISLWIRSLKDQECQITGLSMGTLQNREQEEAVKAIIRIAGPKLQRLSVDYTLLSEDDQPPLLLEGNSNLESLRIGTFSARSRSSNAIRPICAIIDSICSVKMSYLEFVIEVPLDSGPRILAERQQWSQLEDRLLSQRRRQGPTHIHWMLTILKPDSDYHGSNNISLQRTFRRIFTKLSLTGLGRVSTNYACRPEETGFEVWI